jgi:hypothetical protein
VILDILDNHDAADHFGQTISLRLQESIFRHRIVKELGPFVLFLIVFVAAFDSIYLRMLWFIRRVWLKLHHRHSCQLDCSCRPRRPPVNSCPAQPTRQIDVSSRRRSYKIHREILPFEWHSRNVNLSYSLLEHALYWQEEFPGDRKRYMRARKFNRGAQFVTKEP